MKKKILLSIIFLVLFSASGINMAKASDRQATTELVESASIVPVSGRFYFSIGPNRHRYGFDRFGRYRHRHYGFQGYDLFGQKRFYHYDRFRDPRFHRYHRYHYSPYGSLFGFGFYSPYLW